jgi:hypothetical protein
VYKLRPAQKDLVKAGDVIVVHSWEEALLAAGLVSTLAQT